MEPGGIQWLYTLERRAILPVKWLMCLLCLALIFIRSPENLPSLVEFVLLVLYFFSNLVFSYLIYFRRVTPEQLRPVSILSFSIDVFVMASFIYLTGGIDSDYFILFFLIILRGMGFFPTARLNVAANIVVGLIYVGTLFLAGYDSQILHAQDFYQKILLVVGVVLLSWFLIEIQAQQNRHLIDVNRRLFFERTYVQNLLEAMTAGVNACDSGRQVTTLTAAARDILQIHPDARQPEEILACIPGPILKACQRFFQSGRETTDETLEAKLRGGELLTLRLSIRGLEESEEDPGGMVAIFEDLSALRRTEEQLWQSEKLASVGQLAAGVAHELGNPIGIIKSCAEYLGGEVRKSPVDDSVKESLGEEVEVIASESARCQRILKELLSYSSQDAIALESVDAGELMHRAQGLVAYNVPEDRIRLEAEIPERPVWVKADSNLLIQALVNILLNAIQSIEKQGRIQLRILNSPDSAASNAPVGIEVEDTGCGIPPEQLRRIFEPFFTTRDEGTGLGLAITHRIVERLGGRIEAESQPGRGSRFRIWLQAGDPRDQAPRQEGQDR
jgi:signal transduction histidine kinase